IPIVMALVNDPVGQGLVDVLARPSGNVTGPSIGVGPELLGKRLELLKEAIAKVSRVSVLWDPNNPGSPRNRSAMEPAARALGLALRFVAARRPADLEPAFAALERERPDALIVLNSNFIVNQLARIVMLVAKSRLPAMYMESRWVDGGGLMSYGASYVD